MKKKLAYLSTRGRFRRLPQKKCEVRKKLYRPKRVYFLYLDTTGLKKSFRISQHFTLLYSSLGFSELYMVNIFS